MIETFEKNATKPAVTYLMDDGCQDVMTFGEVKNIITKWLNKLEQCGIHSGDRVAIISPTSPLAICAIFALALSNIIVNVIAICLMSIKI